MTMDLFSRHGTSVVNVRTNAHQCEVYCGRAVPSKGFAESLWANRHVLHTEADRPAVLAAYERDLDANPILLCRLVELRGKRLGCWCAPKPCHCDILARRADSPSKEILVAHFRARHTFGLTNNPRPEPADWVQFLKRHGLIPATEPDKWANLSEEAATVALQGLAAVHACVPLDKARRAA